MLTTDTRRDAADRDFFYEPGLQFGIRKPPGWRFLATSRSPARPLARASRQVRLERGRHASRSWRWCRTSPAARHPRPTIQVTCRPAAQPDDARSAPAPGGAARLPEPRASRLRTAGLLLRQHHRRPSRRARAVPLHAAAAVRGRDLSDARAGPQLPRAHAGPRVHGRDVEQRGPPLLRRRRLRGGALVRPHRIAEREGARTRPSIARGSSA